MNPRVAIVGTVGVPARYGGFETLAQALAENVSPAEFSLFFYCQKSAYRPSERSRTFLGHRRMFLPLAANGASSVLYDLLSITDAVLFRKCETVLCLGASGAPGFLLAKLLRPRTKIVFNVDGLESRRARWSGFARLVLTTLEWLGVRTADVVVTDNRIIRSMVFHRFRRTSTVIAYGGDNATPGDSSVSTDLEDLPDRYVLAISRIVPENNVHLILGAFAASPEAIVYVGNWQSSGYGRDLHSRYAGHSNIRLFDPIYDKRQLDQLRAQAIACVHGHSVGGTNPALVEAIFWAPTILAFDCGFNRATLQGKYHYWRDVTSLRALLEVALEFRPPPDGDIAALRTIYRWKSVADAYCRLFHGLREAI